MFNRFDLDNFPQTPRVVLLGMLGVFVALLVIYVSILLLNRVFRDKKKKD